MLRESPKPRPHFHHYLGGVEVRLLNYELRCPGLSEEVLSEPLAGSCPLESKILLRGEIGHIRQFLFPCGWFGIF
jgi:hypothetical protein